MFRLTFICNLTLYTLLLEGCIGTEEHNMCSGLLWHFNNNLHIALLILCCNYSILARSCQPQELNGLYTSSISLLSTPKLSSVLLTKLSGMSSCRAIALGVSPSINNASMSYVKSFILLIKGLLAHLFYYFFHNRQVDDAGCLIFVAYTLKGCTEGLVLC